MYIDKIQQENTDYEETQTNSDGFFADTKSAVSLNSQIIIFSQRAQ